MHFVRFLIFVGTLAVATSSSETGLRLLFPIDHRQYIYDIKTNVSISTQPVSNKSSLWLLEGILSIQAYDNYTKARFYLDFRKKTLIGNTGNHDFFETEGDAFLKNPWELDYQDNGFIKSIYVSDEPTWSVNLKRAVSVNFQLTKNSGPQTTYSMNEPCLDEICRMVYTIKGNSIRKYTSVRVPTARSSYSWGSVPWTAEYSGLLYVDSISASERIYEMDSQKGLINFDLKGSYQYKTHDHILSVTSDLHLYLKEDIPGKSIEKLNLSQTTIQYVAGDFSDPTNGIANFTQFHLTNKSYNILLKIARKGIDADNIVRNASLIHNLDFIELLNTMSQLHYESLIKLFNDLVLGTSYDMETSRNIFLEILPHLRSDACARFIKYLVLEEKSKVEDAALLSLIRKLPFNIATHSQSLLEELEVFTKLSLDFPQDIRHAGILSFATLAHKTMEDNQVKQDYFENIVVKYFRMYSDCPQYLDRMVWLQGLCNIGYSAESYTKIIYGDASRNKHERLWAALTGTHMTDGLYMVLESTLPILTNETEDLQLRIVSLHLFLSSPSVRETDFIFVHNYVMGCNNKHLKRFWLSSVKHLAMNRDFTGYRVASYYIPFVANQVGEPDDQYWATNNYIISGTQEDGAPSLQVMSVGDDLGALPGFVGLKIYTGGRRPYKAAIYVITEGVISNIKEYKRLYEFNPEDINAEKLLDVLKDFKTWGLKKSEKLHIDVVVKLHDKTVFATHLNQSRFERWNNEDFEYFVDFLRYGSHINQQIVYYPFQTDVHLSTELGTPIRLQSTILSFTSIRGNLTAPSNQDSTNQDSTWRNDLHIRYQGTAVTTLVTAAPLLQTVHVARIQQTLVAHVPMKFNVSLASDSHKHIVLTWPNPGDQQAGVAMHSRAEVTTETKTEGYDFMLEKGLIENRKDSIFFDCERPMTGAEVLNKLLASNTKHQDFFHSIQPSLVILNAIVLFSSPPSGSCGVILQPRLTASNDVLEISIRLDNFKFNDILELGAGFKLDYYSLDQPDKSRYRIGIEADSKFQKTDGHADIHLNIIGKHLNGEEIHNEWKVCLQLQESLDTSFLKDISSSSAAFNGVLLLNLGEQNCSADSQLKVSYGVPGGGQQFQVRIEGKNLSKMAVLENDFISQTAWSQILRANSEDPMNITAVIKERNGLTTLKVNNSPDMKLQLENFAWLLHRWTDIQIKKNFGFYRQCRLKNEELQTFSGDAEQLPSSQCPQDLLTADCSDKKPRFAVLRIPDGVKIFSGEYSLSLKTVDDNIIVDEANAADKFWISMKNETYKVTTKFGNVITYYRTNDIVVLVPRLYVSTLCGICSDVNEYNVC